MFIHGFGRKVDLSKLIV